MEVHITIKARDNLHTDIFVEDTLILTIEAHPDEYPQRPYCLVSSILPQTRPFGTWYSSYEKISRDAFKLISNFVLDKQWTANRWM